MTIDPCHPMARPQLNNVQTRPAIFKDNQFSMKNLGAVSYDAKWSEYGAYLHKMLEAIQYQWDRILIESQTSLPPGSMVTVKFTIDSKGKITDIGVLERQLRASRASAEPPRARSRCRRPRWRTGAKI